MEFKKVLSLLLCYSSITGMIKKEKKHNIPKTIIIKDANGKKEAFNFSLLRSLFGTIRKIPTDCCGEPEHTLAVGSIKNLKDLMRIKEKSEITHAPLILLTLDCLGDHLEGEKILETLTSKIASHLARGTFTITEVQKNTAKERAQKIQRAAIIKYDCFPKTLQEREETFKDLDISLQDYIDCGRVKNLNDGLCYLKRNIGLPPKGLQKFFPHEKNSKKIELKNLCCKNLEGAFVPALCNFLTTLDLSHGKLEKVPDEFALFKNLGHLDLENNNISVFPWCEEGGYPSLTILDLENNKIDSIPQRICYMKKLTTIYLAGNMLTFIAPEAYCLKNMGNFI